MNRSRAKLYRSLLLRAFGGCCLMVKENGEICGSKKKLEFAHVQETDLSGIGRGRGERIYDVIKFPWKYDLWCHECHWAHDHPGVSEV